jgi:hypothetical protein
MTQTMFARARSHKPNTSLYVTLALLLIVIGGFIASVARVNSPATDRELRAQACQSSAECV